MKKQSQTQRIYRPQPNLDPLSKLLHDANSSLSSYLEALKAANSTVKGGRNFNRA